MARPMRLGPHLSPQSTTMVTGASDRDQPHRPPQTGSEARSVRRGIWCQVGHVFALGLPNRLEHIQGRVGCCEATSLLRITAALVISADLMTRKLSWQAQQSFW